MTGRPRGFDFPWTVVVCAVAVVTTMIAFASPAVRDVIVADARISDGEVWRALIGPFAHATWGHLLRDVALIAVVGVGYEAPLARIRTPLFIAGIMGPAVAVLAVGQVSWYCGLSGLSHAVLAAAVSYEVANRRGIARALAVAIALGLAIKVVFELATGMPAFPMPLGDGIRQAPVAHGAGVIIGVLGGLAAVMRNRGQLRATGW
ncbi:MAG: rhomboid family intramembrane serine protease [Kofleriaceae bacterium]